MVAGDRAERVVRALVERVEEAAEGAPAHERESKFRAVLHRMLRVGVRGRELVLHGDQLVAENLAGDVDLRVVHAGNARVPDHALVKQLLQRADLVLISHFRVRSVRVQQVQRLHAEVRGRLLCVADHRFRTRIRHPPVLAAHSLQMLAFRLVFGNVRRLHGAAIAGFGCNQHFVARTVPAGERVAHHFFAVAQVFGGAGAGLAWQVIRPGGVQISHTRVQAGVNRTNRSIAVRTPLNRQSHRAHAEPWNCKSRQFAHVSCGRHNRLPSVATSVATKSATHSRTKQRGAACRAPARR